MIAYAMLLYCLITDLEVVIDFLLLKLLLTPHLMKSLAYVHRWQLGWQTEGFGHICTPFSTAFPKV